MRIVSAMDTVSSIIDAFGSAAEVGRELHIPEVTPRAWRRRNRIPTNYWPDLIAAGRRRGLLINADTLLCAHTTKTFTTANQLSPPPSP